MAKLRTGDWVLVADGGKALLLRNDGDTERLSLTVVEKQAQENPPDREQKTDRPGRYHDSGPGQKSAYEETDFHAQAKQDFAAGLAEALNARAERGEVERIVLVASAEVLGVLRPKLSARTAGAVTGELRKVLTNHPVDKLERILLAELDAA